MPTDWAETESLRALRELVATSERLNRVVARRAGLSESELVTLSHLSREQIGPAEVARRLDVSTAAATGIVDRLVGRGHVERQPHAGDRRRTELVITESGRREVVQHLLPMFAALHRLDRSFSPEEREVVARYLHGVTRAYGAVLADDSAPTGPPTHAEG